MISFLLQSTFVNPSVHRDIEMNSVFCCLQIGYSKLVFWAIPQEFSNQLIGIVFAKLFSIDYLCAKKNHANIGYRFYFF